ncbi:MAG TPA: AsmA family protein [Microvirga sp.]|jgi:AsmA protein
MRRRVFLLIALVVLALLATAVAPWTLSNGGFSAVVAQALRERYGIEMQVQGRSTLAILPVPRVKFENVALASADGSIAVKGGTLRGELAILPLLVGQASLTEIALSEAEITVRDAAARTDWAALVRSGKAANGSVRRLIVTNTRLRAFGGSVENVNTVVRWPGGESRLDVAGTFTWRNENVEITRASMVPATLASGQPSAFTVSVATSFGKAVIDGEVQTGNDPRVTGHSSLEFRSVRDFARWTGLDLPLGSMLHVASVEGDFSADRRRLSWPSVTLQLGADTLEGTLSLRFDGQRSIVTGTLAADRLDLTDYFAPFLQARTSSGMWSGEDAVIAGTTGGDLDLRLSASDARIGRLRLSEMAASVLVRPGRVEVSLSRAGLNKGSVKGRLALASVAGGTDLRGQATFDRIEASGLLSDLGRSRWIAGPTSGQVTLESTGRTVADLVRQVHGRATATIRQGELIGIGLGDALRRAERQPLAASLEWKGGRTPFDLAQITLNVGAGTGEITEGLVLAPTMRTAVQGTVSLIDRSVGMRILVDPAVPGGLPSPVIALEVAGGWDDVAVVPDARALIQRSGAAKPLFGDRIAPAGSSRPQATAQ